jgi:hypothetical protein
MKIRKMVLLVLLNAFVVLPGSKAAAAAEQDDPWKPFQFMMGEWVGASSAQSQVSGQGEFSLAYDLDKKILVRRNRNSVMAKAGKDAAIHQDLMIIYPQPPGGSFRAEYFDNEGHVIHYGITVAEHKIVFESDSSVAGPRYRLTYEQKPDGLLEIDFEIAAPGKAFQRYISGTVKRK